jgi:hypothetical protein
MKKRMYLFLIVILFISFVSATIELDTALLKVSLEKGNSVTKTISLRSDLEESVFLNTENIQGISLSADSFFIPKNVAKNFDILFDSRDLNPGVYFGSLVVNSENQILKLPLVFEVESADLFYDGDIDVPLVYSDVYPGGKIVVQLKIFDLTFGSDGLKDSAIKLKYTIHSSEGYLIVSEEDNIQITKDLSITKSMILPETIKTGTYFISAEIIYGNSVAVSSGLFTVSPKLKSFLNDFGKRLDVTFFIIFILLLVFAGLIFFFIYLLRDRDKLFLELKKQNSLELQQQREFLLGQQKFLSSKKVPDKKIQKEINSKINNLKKIQKKRIEEFKKIKKTKNIKDAPKLMKEKLNIWKAQGYNTLLLESKLSGLSNSDMKKVMNKWKKQGYH